MVAALDPPKTYVWDIEQKRGLDLSKVLDSCQAFDVFEDFAVDVMKHMRANLT